MRKVTMLWDINFNEKFEVFVVLKDSIENVRLFKNRKEALFYGNCLGEDRLVLTVSFDELEDSYIYAYKDDCFTLKRKINVDNIPNDFNIIELQVH